MAFLVYSDEHYETWPQGKVVYENTEKAAVNEFVRSCVGSNRTPREGQEFQLTPLGQPKVVHVKNSKAAFQLVEGYPE